MSRINRKIERARTNFAEEIEKRDARTIEQQVDAGQLNDLKEPQELSACPMLRSAMNAGIIEFDDQGRATRESVGKAVQFLVGAPKFAGTLIGLGGDPESTIFNGAKINLAKLKDGLFNHLNDTGMTENGWNEEAFQKLINHNDAAADGILTRSELQASLRANATEMGLKGKLGTFIGAEAEIGGLFTALGRDLGEISKEKKLFRTKVSVDPAITVEDLRNFYQHNLLPDFVLDRIVTPAGNGISVSASELRESTLGGIQGQAMTGLETFAGEEPSMSQGVAASQGLKTGLCPVGGVDVGAVTQAGDVTEIHNQVGAE